MRLLFTLLLIGSVLCIPLFSQTNSSDTCRIFVQVEPADVTRWARLLATPAIVPDDEIIHADYRKMETWDLPSKITAWRERLGWLDYVTQKQELNQLRDGPDYKRLKYNEKELLGRKRNWMLRPIYGFAPAEEKQLAKLFDTNGVSRYSGVCSDPQKATYILEVGAVMIVNRNLSSTLAPPKHGRVRLLNVQTIDYSKPLDQPQVPEDARGYDSGYPSSVLNGQLADAPSGFACVYLYKSDTPAPARYKLWRPAFYYCPYGGIGKLSGAANKMLEFLSKDPQLKNLSAKKEN